MTGHQASPFEHQLESIIYVENAFDLRCLHTAKLFAWCNNLNSGLTCELRQGLSSFFRWNVKS